MKEHDIVKLKEPWLNYKTGTRGTIIHIYKGNDSRTAGTMTIVEFEDNKTPNVPISILEAV